MSDIINNGRSLNVSTPADIANNSNNDQLIETITVKCSMNSKNTKSVRILKNPINYLDQTIDFKNLYEEQTDKKGNPILKRIEKYPDLPEDIFIPIDYEHKGIIKTLKIPNNVLVNKSGEILYNFKYLLKARKNYDDYYLSKIYNCYIMIHRIVASTFLINPNKTIYDTVNHIDSNPSNYNLNNLEFVTQSLNSSDKKSLKKNRKLTKYIAIDNKGKEILTLDTKHTTVNGKTYDLGAISNAIKNNKKSYGYFWKIVRPKTNSGFSRDELLKQLGFTKIENYNWEKHSIYPNVLVCKEGFVRCGKHLKISCYVGKNNYLYASLGPGQTRQIHRILMDHKNGRKLNPDEVVDHLDGNKWNNEINNLTITTQEGNMNNPITKSKSTKRDLIKLNIDPSSLYFVLADLFGDYIEYDYLSNLIKISYPNKNLDTGNRCSKYCLANILNKKYICIKPGDKDSLIDKMKRVIYVISPDKTKIINAFTSTVDLINELDLESVSIQNISKLINSGKLGPDGNYYMKGEEAVKLVLSLGHGTAANFKPEEIN